MKYTFLIQKFKEFLPYFLSPHFFERQRDLYKYDTLLKDL